MSSRKVAFIGLGVMGFPMAGHLANAGHDVTVYNRNAAKSKAWAKAYKGRTAATPAAAAKGADIVFSCVGNDDDLRSVVYGDKGIFAGLAKGAIFVDHTTASATVAREIHAAGRKLGFACIDAPVSGGQAGAESGAHDVLRLVSAARGNVLIEENSGGRSLLAFPVESSVRACLLSLMRRRRVSGRRRRRRRVPLLAGGKRAQDERAAAAAGGERARLQLVQYLLRACDVRRAAKT